ncbi:MAG: hypothetical protein LLF99_17925, partial [Desulfobacteraceae bacterium]|nr:hypothetical protein [Desulfobacteraceae bacterium]
CPGAKIVCITDATGALYDPEGADRQEMARIVLKADIHEFNPEALHKGGFMLFSRHTRMEALKQLYRKVERTDAGLKESWITVDEYYKEIDAVLFNVPVNLFLPCGGRPETIDANNWSKWVKEDGKLTAPVIVEGANSFISPAARECLQKNGVIIVRDSSANKCGVITSSYEIIANLLMSEKEFLKHKDVYVRDVLEILDKRARDEANLIFRRYKEAEGKLLYTEISAGLSEEINEHYDRLFGFFCRRTDLLEKPVIFNVLLRHMPAFVRENVRYRARVKKLPVKIQCAILASEIASTIVYNGGWEDDFEGSLTTYLEAHFK